MRCSLVEPRSPPALGDPRLSAPATFLCAGHQHGLNAPINCLNHDGKHIAIGTPKRIVQTLQTVPFESYSRSALHQLVLRKQTNRPAGVVPRLYTTAAPASSGIAAAGGCRVLFRQFKDVFDNRTSRPAMCCRKSITDHGRDAAVRIRCVRSKLRPSGFRLRFLPHSAESGELGHSDALLRNFRKCRGEACEVGIFPQTTQSESPTVVPASVNPNQCQMKIACSRRAERQRCALYGSLWQIL